MFERDLLGLSGLGRCGYRQQGERKGGKAELFHDGGPCSVELNCRHHPLLLCDAACPNVGKLANAIVAFAVAT
jgi:hypothetical protein